MSFKADEKKIRLLMSNAVYAIPRNQRRYVWDKTNWHALYEDINFVVNTPKYNKDHFIGSIVLQSEKSKDNIDHYTIIDGQQRIITISLFLSAIMYILKERGLKNDFKGMRSFLISKNIKDEEECVINSDFHLSIARFIYEICDLDKKITTTLRAQLNQIVIDKKIDKPIIDCLVFYYDLLSKLSDKEVLNIRNGIINTNYIDIRAESTEDSYTIFEILNARGQSLEDHELLKNFIMRYVTPQKKKRIDIVKSDWENVIDRSLGTYARRFLKHYATHRYALVNRNRIYEEIKNNTKLSEVNTLLDDILLKARYYEKLISPITEGQDANCSKVEYEVFNFFNIKRAEQFRPIILSFIHHKNLGDISEEEYTKYLLFMYNFFICYNIIGEDKSNKLEDVIYKYASLLENAFSDDNCNKFMDGLIIRLPNKETFSKNFVNIGWSNHTAFYSEQKNKDRVKLVLEVIEKHISRKNQIDDFSVEHILPDSEKEEHALIGNLLPLEENLNNKCSDKPLVEKIKYYKRSNFAITRGFAERYEQDQKFSIDSRGKHLATMLYDQILKF